MFSNPARQAEYSVARDVSPSLAIALPPIQVRVAAAFLAMEIKCNDDTAQRNVLRDSDGCAFCSTER